MISFERLVVFIFLISFLSCQKPVNKHQKIGNIKIENNILNCEKVFYFDKINKIEDHFFYGEILKMNFDELEGFKQKEGLIYPGLKLLVLNKNKDTMLFNNDLYKDEIDGFDATSFELTPQITLANPIKSKSKYKVYTHLWDKIGDGNFKTETKISVVPNNEIKIKNTSLKYKEVYLYSDKRDKVILNKKTFLNENIYFIIEGLEGFTLKDGNAAPGASITVTDSSGNKIFENPDLFKDSEKYSLSDIKERFSPYITFNEKENGNIKIRCRIKVWDKNNKNKSLILSTNLLLVDDN